MLAVKAVLSGIQQISHVPSVQNICVDSINKHLVSTDRTTLRKLLLLSGPQYLYLKNGQVKTASDIPSTATMLCIYDNHSCKILLLLRAKVFREEFQKECISKSEISGTKNFSA